MQDYMPSIDVIKGNLHKSVPTGHYDTYVEPKLHKLRKDIDYENAVFDPERHIIFKDDMFDSVKIHTLQDLGLDPPDKLSEFGIAEPFPFFSDEAIEIMRFEIFQKKTFETYARVANISTNALDVNIGGYARHAAPFIHAAINHPETLRIMSKLAGVELKVLFDYETGHINFGIKGEEQVEREKKMKPELQMKVTEFLDGKHDENVDAVVNWHFDSNPYTMVLMASDTEGMVGGETVVTLGDGTLAIAKNPTKGNVALIQAGVIRHMAMLPYCAPERITIVTALSPSDPLLPDPNVITTIKPSVLHRSRHNEFYPEWVDYRMKTLEARCRNTRERCMEKSRQGEDFNQLEMVKQFKELIDYVKGTFREFEVIDEGLETVD